MMRKEVQIVILVLTYRSIKCVISTDFEELQLSDQSFAQRKKYSNQKTINQRFNHRKLFRFRGLSHGENIIYLRGTVQRVGMHALELTLFLL